MYIPMWHIWSSNLFFFDRWSANGWKFGWIRCETLGMYWRIFSWCLMDIHATDLWYEFERNESHPDRFRPFRTCSLQGTSDCKGRQPKCPPLQRCGHTLLHNEIASHWRTQAMWMSQCVTLLQIHPKAVFEIFRWDPLYGGTMSKTNQYTMLNHILIHFERFHDIAENIRKREGAIATCSDTLTTARFPQSYSKSKTESQQLGTCQTWLLTLPSTDLSP